MQRRAQHQKPPIIDIHMHTYQFNRYGDPPRLIRSTYFDTWGFSPVSTETWQFGDPRPIADFETGLTLTSYQKPFNIAQVWNYELPRIPGTPWRNPG